MQRQQPVADVVGEQKHAVPAEEPRAVHDVGAALADQLDQLRELLRRYSRSASWMTTRSPVTSWNPRRSAAPLPPFAAAAQLERQLALRARQDVPRPVLRPVVHDDQLDADRHRQHAADDLLDRRALVVDGITTESSGSVSSPFSRDIRRSPGRRSPGMRCAPAPRRRDDSSMLLEPRAASPAPLALAPREEHRRDHLSARSTSTARRVRPHAHGVDDLADRERPAVPRL